jgi:hypothetical protein
MAVGSVAIIGSFRQRYEEALEAWRTFTAAGLTVTSPRGDPIVEAGIPFVRFTSDSVGHSDSLVQTIALHRIMRADFTYVVAPDGYVGRTTCYEVGRVLQACRPLYFSEPPQDLPLLVPISHLAAPGALLARFVEESPRPWYTPDHGLFDDHDVLERDLRDGTLHDV